MKEYILKTLRSIVSDRYFFILAISLFVVAVVIAIVMGILIKPSERQIITHYTAFGSSQFYFDQWFYLINFAVFEVFVALINIAIAIKIMIIKGRTFAIMYLWFSFLVVFIGLITAVTIFNLRNLL